MESFMWVLIYLCLTRKGPGGFRRDELNFDVIVDDTTAPLHTIVDCFFDTDDRNLLARNKCLLFQDPGDMEACIISQFHPYFKALGPLVSDWWQVLQRSYQVFDFTTIHDLFLAAVDKAIRALPADPDAAGTASELDRRRADLNQSLTPRTKATGPNPINEVSWAASPERVKLVSSCGSGIPGVTEEPPSSPTPQRKKIRILLPGEQCASPAPAAAFKCLSS